MLGATENVLFAWQPLTIETIALLATLAVVAWYTLETYKLRTIEQERLDEEREYARRQLDPEFEVNGTYTLIALGTFSGERVG